jgi:predicted aldo/keto reductase-like oxidoreductase
MTRSIEKGLRELGLDYTDVLLLGWWNLPPPERLLDAAAGLVHQGKARYIMISCHNRPNFPVLARDPRVSLLMIRYNAAHPGAERDVFPYLANERPGIVAYTTTSWGQLLNPVLVPAGERAPTAGDCYRFVLSSPHIDACYTGAKTGVELDGAMRALDLGPMSVEELAWMRRVGASVRQRTRLDSLGKSIIDRFVNLASGFGFRATNELPRGQ